MKRKRLKILIADDMNPRGTGILKKKFYVVQKTGISNKEILNKYNGFDALIIRSIRKIDEVFLKKTGIGVIATCSKGVDHIDVKAAEKYGKKIINSESGNTISAAEHTVGMILNILKRINLSDTLVRKGEFNNYDFPRTELRGKKAGIIGYGRVGSYTANLLSAFNCRVFANDNNPEVVKKNPSADFRSASYIFRNCDIVSVHIPMSKANENFISGRLIGKMKKDSILINTSRGGVMDEKFLIKYLEQGKIYFCGLDVFKHEPCIDKRFMKLKNVLLTNHIAGKTSESSIRIAVDIANTLTNYFENKF